MQRGPLLATLLVALCTTPLEAQVLGTPIFQSPYRDFKQSELAGYFSDPGSGIGVGLQGEYRIARSNFDLGITAGYLSGSGTNNSLFGVGLEGRVPVAGHTKDFPLDATLTGGFGALFGGGESGFLVPFGVSLGRQLLLEDSNISFTPYLNPVIIPTFGKLYGDLQFALGLGVSIALSRTLDARVSGSLGDISGVGLGLAWHR